MSGVRRRPRTEGRRWACRRCTLCTCLRSNPGRCCRDGGCRGAGGWTLPGWQGCVLDSWQGRSLLPGTRLPLPFPVPHATHQAQVSPLDAFTLGAQPKVVGTAGWGWGYGVWVGCLGGALGVGSQCWVWMGRSLPHPLPTQPPNPTHLPLLAGLAICTALLAACHRLRSILRVDLALGSGPCHSSGSSSKSQLGRRCGCPELSGVERERVEHVGRGVLARRELRGGGRESARPAVGGGACPRCWCATPEALAACRAATLLPLPCESSRKAARKTQAARIVDSHCRRCFLE